MLLAISALMAVLPLAGIAFLVATNPNLDVDNLFMSLILLTISGMFGLNVLMELRNRGLKLPLLGAAPAMAGGGHYATEIAPVALPSGEVRERGLVEHVAYFESVVGQPNRLVVTLRPGGDHTPSRMLVFRGDVRDQFPVGRKVEVVYRKDGGGGAELVERKYLV